MSGAVRPPGAPDQATNWAEKPPAWKSWGALLRLSLLPSALADVVAGLLLSGVLPLRLAAWPAFAASLLIYHGGMALNDWRDRELDRPLRPGRPLVSGALRPGAALTAGLIGLLLGPLLGALGAPLAGALWLAVAACAALYDLWPWARRSSPLWLGACRAGNLLAAAAFGRGLMAADAAGHGSNGHSAASSAAQGPLAQSPDLSTLIEAWRELPSAALIAALGYGLYVAAVSFLARLEDDPLRVPGGRPRPRLLLCAALLASLAPLVAWGGGWLGVELTGSDLAAADRPTAVLAVQLLGVAIALGSALGLVQAAFAQAAWTHGEVARDVGRCLRRLLIATAALSLASGASMALPGAGLILLGYPLAHGLRKIFPPS